mgnify:CR=1 FL=1
MIDSGWAYLIIIFLLIVHLFFQIGYQYQALNLLDEIAFPIGNPVMTSTLVEDLSEEEDLLDGGQSTEKNIPTEPQGRVARTYTEAFNEMDPLMEFHGVTVQAMGPTQALREILREKFPTKRGVYWDTCQAVDKENNPCKFATRPGERLCWQCDETARKAWAKENEPTWIGFEEESKPKTSILYEVGHYTSSGEATLRQIKEMRKDDVIGICEIHGLDTEGTKAILIERIKENAA